MKPKIHNRFPSGLTLIALSFAGFTLQPATAATLAWDADGIFNNGVLGGTGIWNTTSAHWDNGAADTTWATNIIAGDTAVFGGTAGDVTVGSAINALGLQVNTAGYTISGANTLALGTGGIDASALSSGTTTISTTTLNIGAAQAWNVGPGSALSVSSLLTGGTLMTKSGAGSLTLSGISTGYTGGLRVTGGTATLTGQLSPGGSQAAVGVSVNSASGQTATFTSSGVIGAGVNTIDGATFVVGNTAGGTGIFNMTGGFIRTQASGGTPASREFHVGRNGFGAANISGGTLDIYGFLVAGIANSGAAGIWNIGGGTVSTRDKGTRFTAATLGASVGTTGVMNVTGGTFNSVGLQENGSTSANDTAGIFVGENAVGTLNVSGTGAVNAGSRATSNGLKFGHVNVATASGLVNLGAVGTGGGTITTNRVQKPGALASGTFNFHGGTLKSNLTPNATFMGGLNAAYVYGEGGTIDNNSQVINITQALLTPASKGASAISTTGFATTTGYTTAPLVAITGGSGTGMTANAFIDGGGNLNGFTVTNPGTGYLAGDSITVTLSGGGYSTTSASTTAVTLADNLSGGLTFTGSGTSTLSSASTYTGATNVTGGTLTTGAAGSLASSGITLNGFGAKLLQNSATPITAPITITEGSLDGTTTIGAVTIASLIDNTLSNGNGGTTTLTLGSLVFGGDATVNAKFAGTSTAFTVTGALTTTPANGTVVVNATNTSAWATGNYNIFSAGSTVGVAASNFTLGSVTGVGARQSASITKSGNSILLSIAGDNPRWTGLQNNRWTIDTIGGLSNWKLQTAGTATNYINGDLVVFDDTATNTGVDVFNADVFPVSTTFNNTTKDFTISSVGGFKIGAGSLVKGGTGMVTFTNNNTPDSITINAGTLRIGDGITDGSIASTTGILNNASLIYNVVVSQSDANPISGTGNVTKTGAGTLLLSGTNSFNGGLNINGGTLQAGSADALGATTNPLSFGVAANGILQVNGNSVTVGSISGDSTAIIENSNAINGTFRISNTGADSFSGILRDGSLGTLGLTKTGAGSLALTAANTYTGLTTVQDGQLRIATGGSIPSTASVNMNGTGVLILGDAVGPVNQTLSSVFGGSVVGGNAGISTLTINTTAGFFTQTVFGGAGTDENNLALVKLGTGLFMFQAPNTFTGGIFIKEGDLRAQNVAGTLGNNAITLGDATLGANASLIFNNNLVYGSTSVTVDSGLGTRTIRALSNGATTFNSGGIVLNNDLILATNGNNVNNPFTVTGVISGSGGIIVTGTASPVLLNGINTYTGNTTVTSGTLAITNAYLADTSDIAIADGGRMTLNFAGTDTVDGLTLGGAPKAPGVYGSTLSGAAIIDDVHFTGTGTLTVTTGPAGYAGWAADQGLTVGVNDGANQDPDFDGIQNLLEYVLGGDPIGAGASDTSILPVESLDATHLKLTFHRSDLSESDTTPIVQLSTGLGIWTNFATVGATSAGSVPAAAVAVTEDSPDPALDTVTVSIPRSNEAGGKLFARLSAVKN